MNTATTTERIFTAREALQAIEAGNKQITLAAIEEFEMHLGEPRLCGGRWLAGCRRDDKRFMEFGDTVAAAVKAVLRKIGGVNG